MSFYLAHHTSPQAKLICLTSVSALLTYPTPITLRVALVSIRLPILIARPRPNANARKLMKQKGEIREKERPVTSWHRQLRHVPTSFVTGLSSGFIRQRSLAS
jgi:hypothetical protein